MSPPNITRDGGEVFSAVAADGRREREAEHVAKPGFVAKRLTALEPSTFCMAKAKTDNDLR
jgi:hypothetical protein